MQNLNKCKGNITIETRGYDHRIWKIKWERGWGGEERRGEKGGGEQKKLDSRE